MIIMFAVSRKEVGEKLICCRFVCVCINVKKNNTLKKKAKKKKLNPKTEKTDTEPMTNRGRFKVSIARIDKLGAVRKIRTKPIKGSI